MENLRNPQNSPQTGGEWSTENNRPDNADFKNISPQEFLRRHPIKPDWITKGANEEMVDFADKAGKFMKEKKLTKSKIRSIYGEIKRIQINGFEKEKNSFYLLRPKMAYTLGRDKDNEGLKLFKMIFDYCANLVANS